MFYVVYGVMNSMNARYFDVDNYLICARDIEGPWSEPVYLHSAGFDASLLHDTDGRKWIVSLEWETREAMRNRAPSVWQSIPRKKGSHRLSKTYLERRDETRGCIEAPHLTKKRRAVLYHVRGGRHGIQSLCDYGKGRECLGTL